MSDDDLAELRLIFSILQEKSKEFNVTLDWVEIKGTIFFFPRLQAKS